MIGGLGKKLVETTTLASVRGPPVTAQLFGGGAPPAGLSNVQLEAIALATQAHDDERALREQGSRRGLLCGDGTGCGKGRTIAGCVLHNYGAGRQRSVWVTASAGLARDARRDLDDIEGGKAVPSSACSFACLRTWNDKFSPPYLHAARKKAINELDRSARIVPRILAANFEQASVPQSVFCAEVVKIVV